MDVPVEKICVFRSAGYIDGKKEFWTGLKSCFMCK